MVSFLNLSCSKNSEVNDIIHKKWESILIKCNGSIYILEEKSIYDGSILATITELKDYYINIKSYGIDKADKLNGIEWDGVSEINFSAYRQRFFGGYYQSGVWSRWSTGGCIRLYIRKIKGVWNIKDGPICDLGLFQKYKSILDGDCRYIQKYIK